MDSSRGLRASAQSVQNFGWRLRPRAEKAARDSARPVGDAQGIRIEHARMGWSKAVHTTTSEIGSDELKRPVSDAGESLGVG